MCIMQILFFFEMIMTTKPFSKNGAFSYITCKQFSVHYRNVYRVSYGIIFIRLLMYVNRTKKVQERFTVG